MLRIKLDEPLIGFECVFRDHRQIGLVRAQLTQQFPGEVAVALRRDRNARCCGLRHARRGRGRVEQAEIDAERGVHPGRLAAPVA